MGRPRSPKRWGPVPGRSGGGCVEGTGSRPAQLYGDPWISPGLAFGFTLKCGPRGITAARSFSAPG
eukprot:3222568-Alexandrium_andersonii.AAC.1